VLGCLQRRNPPPGPTNGTLAIPEEERSAHPLAEWSSASSGVAGSTIRALCEQWQRCRAKNLCRMNCTNSAYDDRPLPIGYGQTISQPFIVVLMTQRLQPKASDRVLEIGTGSGYQAAILSELAGEVYTIEIVPPLAQHAEGLLHKLGYNNVHVKAGDGYKGWPEQAPFDGIIVTAAPDYVPQPLVEQLKEGGRMVIPVGKAGAQMLYLLEKRGGKIKQKAVIPVKFVPFTRDHAEDRKSR